MRRVAKWTLVPLLCVAIAAGCGAASAGGGGPAAVASEPAAPGGPEMAADWKEIERLISERKLEAAAGRVTELREAAAAAGEEALWTRALVREVQLRTALGGFETAVRLLREARRPDNPVYGTALDLLYAHGLANYLSAYSWEINQRERVESRDAVDLDRWTAAQILAEADGAFRETWSRRSAWGERSLGLLAEHIEQNNYPARIRGTLRDAVTYLWVEMLADSSRWSAAESNGLFRLDLPSLLAADGEEADAVVADPAVHPLERLVSVLADLEDWHSAGDRPEAAFEARLERLRRLHQAFSRAEDRRTIRDDLAARLAAFGRHWAWWSMGRAELAEMVRQEEAADSLVRAREIALEGERAHPGSLGGERCRHVAADIESPLFALEGMASDGPRERSVRVTHKNLERLWFRAYALDLEKTVESSRDYNLLPSYREVPEILARRRPAAEWEVELPATPDYRTHDTYVTPPLSGHGLFVVVASTRRDFAEEGNRRSAINLILTDLVLITRPAVGGYEVTVRSGSSGAAVAGATVELWRYDYRGGHRREESETTGEDGTARFAARRDNASFFLLAARGDDRALDARGRSLRPPREDRRRPPRCLIYTDRSIYRPGQPLRWKVVAYGEREEAARYETLADARVKVELTDANGQVVEEIEVSSNDFGSLSGTFDIPAAGRLLGSWWLRATVLRGRADQPSGSTSVQVEEYKRPTFEVTLVEPEEPLRLNRPAELAGEARYYFGLPVVGGTADWRVTREPVYPRWWWWSWPSGRQRPETVAAGRSETDSDGRFRVAFLPEADEREADTPGISYRYRLSVDVTDEGGETRSADRVFRLGFVSVEATLEADAGFFTADSAAGFTLRRASLDGAPRAGAASWRLLELAQPERALLPADQPPAAPPAAPGVGEGGLATPGDRLRPRWSPDYSARGVLAGWEDGRELASGSVTHGDGGEARVELGELPPGAYRLRYATADDFGARFEAAAEFVVAAEGATPLALPAILELEHATVPVGGLVRLLVHSGLPDQEMVLELYAAGERIDRRLLASSDGARVVDIVARAELRGGFSARLTALRDHQLMTSTESVFVPWDDRRLEVSFASFRDLLRPGARESWRVQVKSAEERALAAGSAELLAYMYDRSLDLFAAHSPPDVLDLYPDRRQPGPLWSSLGGASEIWGRAEGFAELPDYAQLRPDRLIFFDRWGIGGPGRMMAFRAADGVVTVTSESPLLAESAQAEPAPPPDGQGGDADPAEPPPGEPEAGEPEAELRSDFSETAFFEPHLVVGDEGEVAFEFTVPDSVTEWNVWVHALTRDLRGGRLERRTRSVKELLVRPYLPRFLREGDAAEIRVVVNNAGERRLAGELDFSIADAETGEDLTAALGLAGDGSTALFDVEPGGGETLRFPLRVPAGVRTLAFRVEGRAGDLSDGELRPLPVLPGRVHLTQSRFAALSDRDRRELTFAELAADDDPSRIDEQLVVTLDAQLFYSVLHALPYLVEYPYECTEQTLNRFLSTGIVSGLYDAYPAVARMAERFAERETRLETWAGADPNRKMALEETPWLLTARGGPETDFPLINVLDPRVAAAHRQASLAKLEQAQTSLGGFPWWPGGPPSPYMTLYLLQGFSRALEFDVEVPKPMVVRAWSYLHRHYLEELVREIVEDECCWQLVTFLNYVLSSYPDASWTGGAFSDDERRRMLDFSFRHWREHSPLLKGQLALTLARAGRAADAELVFDSVMDSAKSDRDLGTFWAPEDRAWLWYNDTIEGHAFALRALTELDPDDARRHGLVHWLFLNKKLNHWKSTRATAEVVYALVHYLEREGQLGAREAAKVTIGPRVEQLVFEPDEYTGRRSQIVVPGPEIEPASMSTVVVEKETPGLLFASASWHFSTERLPERGDGDLLAVSRRYFRRQQEGGEWVLRPLEEGARLAAGDQVEVQLTVRARHAAEYVHLRDPRGAGFEPESLTSRHRWDLGLAYYEEVRDSGTNFFFEWLPAGEYTLSYRLRANLEGAFKAGPATLQSMYAPEFAAYSAGALLEIAD